MRHAKRYYAPVALLLLVLTTAASGPPACESKDQPRSVADILTTAGNAKRQLRDTDRQSPGTGISAQTDYDISFRLVEANRAYKAFINDELARLAADPNAQPNPDARRNALNALVTALKSLEDPGALGIKSDRAKELWRDAVRTIGTVIAGMEALQRGGM